LRGHKYLKILLNLLICKAHHEILVTNMEREYRQKCIRKN